MYTLALRRVSNGYSSRGLSTPAGIAGAAMESRQPCRVSLLLRLLREVLRGHANPWQPDPDPESRHSRPKLLLADAANNVLDRRSHLSRPASARLHRQRQRRQDL